MLAVDTSTPVVEPDEEPGIEIPAHAAALAIALLTASTVAVRFWSPDHGLAAAVKIVATTLVVGVVPGALLTLAWRPRPRLTLLELLGFGAAASFGFVHLLTVVTMSAHVPAMYGGGALVAVAIAVATWLARRERQSVVVLAGGECIISALLIVLAAVLYVQGSPVVEAEDQMHVSIVRRLAEIDAPAIDNVYFAPGIVYTYPFPSTHFFIALVARLADIDPLFAYHKLRVFWGPIAIVMLYLCARAVFASRLVALTVALSALVLVFSGAYAIVPNTLWAQLAPYSHTSDIASGVLLPALLAMAFAYLEAGSRRERSFLFTTAVMLIFLLTVVRIREIVQFGAYLACFIAGSLVMRAHRAHTARAALLLVATSVVVLTYLPWHQGSVPRIADLIGEQRTQVAATMASMPLQTLFFGSAHEVLSRFFYGFDPIFHGLIPFVLFAGPVVVVTFRQRPLVWLISWSTLAYLLVSTIPLLALGYMYATYYEVLFGAIQNFVFFLYLIAGGFVYLTVSTIGRMRHGGAGGLIVAGTTLGAVALLAGLCLAQNQRGFLVPLIVAYGLTFMYFGGGTRSLASPMRVTVVAGSAVLAIALLVIDHRSHAAPPPTVNVRWMPGLDDTRRAALEGRFSLARGELTNAPTNSWAYALLDSSVENVEALVKHSEVADTHHIDRSRFLVEYERPHSDDPVLGAEYVPWLRYPGTVVSVIAVLLVGGLGLVLPAAATWRRRVQPWTPETPYDDRPIRTLAACAAFVVPFAFWTARPALSPLSMTPMPPSGRASTPRAMIEQAPCVTRATMAAPYSENLVGDGPLMLKDVNSCPPTYALVWWMKANVPPDAVLAINRWNQHLPTVFVASQVVVFPGFEAALANEQTLFRDYYVFYGRSLRTHGTQPFFNAAESATERAAFLKTLGVTHVLVDPASYREMRGVLDRLPELVTLKYADGRWAVYEVHRAALQQTAMFPHQSQPGAGHEARGTTPTVSA